MSEVQNKEGQSNSEADKSLPIAVVSGLLSCPFCGKKVYVNENKVNKFFELTHECDNTFSIIIIDSNKDNLIAKWNTRSNSFEPTDEQIEQASMEYWKET